ncbi:LapA family protein [Nocardia crassostreae]|uniref:LapA family protein n=1 Tax=Nocardia crassostreae TaxID=53428 RepID=UPI0008371500|nr:LapA family protein [Nocardia crassostreae]
MFTIIGLIALLGALTVGVAGIQANSGDGHTVTNGFTVFDHTYTGSSGLLFAYGILVGAIGTCGLIMLLAGLWTMSRRGVLARRELRQSKREMAAARRELSKPPPAAKKPAAPAEKPAQPAGSKPVWSVNRFLHRPGVKPPAPSVSK